MSTPQQQLDWSGIRAAAISLGSVNAAAIQAGADLPPDEAKRLRERINKRALRERWMDQAKALQTTAPSNALPLSKPVQNGAEIVQNSLETRKNKSRTHLAKYVQQAAKAAVLSKDKLGVAQNVRHVSAIYTALWPEEQTPGVNINLWGGGSMSQG